MRYKEPLFRPPAEAHSLIFQVAYGCPHNRCLFCGMYKGVGYAEREIGDVLAEFAEGAREFPETRRIFLADGDVMFTGSLRLLEMLRELNALFPRLSRVNIYANASSILKFTEAELREVSRLKLNTLYLGLESGCQELLEKVHKGENAEEMVEAVRVSQACGLKASVMILLGLGGRELSEKHSRSTAEVLNRMQPRLLSALRFVEYPGCRMFRGYAAASEYDAVRELREIAAGVELHKTVFRANHASNPVPLEARFPRDRDKLVEELDGLLESGSLDKNGPGRLPMFL